MNNQTLTYEDLSLKLTEVPNARQLGGYQNLDGKKIKKDVLFRTGNLFKATEEDVKKLSEIYKIKYIFDLRSENEIISKPNKSIPNAQQINLDILASIRNETVKKIIKDKKINSKKDFPTIELCKTPEFVSYIINIYKSIITNREAQLLYQKMFRYMIDFDGPPVLWHCTFGKDRTGLAAIFILSALNVDYQTIKDDFLKTNIAYQPIITELIEVGRKENFDDLQLCAIQCIAGVSEKSFELAYKEINETYGGMTNYLKNQIGLMENDIIRLRELYLE